MGDEGSSAYDSVEQVGYGYAAERDNGEGFDDQFNDGVFRNSLNNSRLTRPQMWPKSVSEMRVHTSFAGQGMPTQNEAAHSEFMERRPYNQRSFDSKQPYNQRF
jgi:hypothetical protein